MKRLLFAFFMLTGALTLSSQHVSAQAVTAASFTAKADLLDSYIGAGNTTMAQTTFDELNGMMKSVLGVTKTDIHAATTAADKTAAETVLHNQTILYRTIWAMKTDLATNRSAIHTKLQEFDLTIH